MLGRDDHGKAKEASKRPTMVAAEEDTGFIACSFTRKTPLYAEYVSLTRRTIRSIDSLLF